jgi:hypothetical protein
MQIPLVKFTASIKDEQGLEAGSVPAKAKLLMLNERGEF